MAKLVAEGRTLIFVSHNLSAVEAICRQGLFLLDGRVKGVSGAGEALQSYLNWVDAAHLARTSEEVSLRPSRYLELLAVGCHKPNDGERYAFATGEDIEVRLRFLARRELTRPYVSIGITDGRPGTLALCSMLVDGGAPEQIVGEVEFRCLLRGVPLLPRVYQLWCSVRGEQAFGDLFDWQPVGAFRIATSPGLQGPAAMAHTATDGPVHIPHVWEVQGCP